MTTTGRIKQRASKFLASELRRTTTLTLCQQQSGQADRAQAVRFRNRFGRDQHVIEVSRIRAARPAEEVYIADAVVGRAVDRLRVADLRAVEIDRVRAGSVVELNHVRVPHATRAAI